MRVSVFGLGRIGSSIAARLSREPCEVMVVDTNAEMVSDFSARYDVIGVVGAATDPDVLRRAKTDQADMIIALTASDNDNIVACQLAHTLFDVPNKIARIRNDQYYDKRNSSLFDDDHTPVDVALSPERLAALDAWHHLSFPSVTTSHRLCADKVALFGFPITDQCPLIEIPLRQLSQYYSNIAVVVLAITRNGKLIVANGNTVLKGGDTVYVTTKTQDATHLMGLFGFAKNAPERIVIAGSGRVGRYVARHIVDSEKYKWLHVIDRNQAHAHRMAAEFEKASILHGNILDPSLLAEAGVAEADVIMTLTNDNRDNIIAGVMAKDMGCESAISLVYERAFARVVSRVGIDGYIDPAVSTESAIVTLLRRGRLTGVYTLADGDAEIVEAIAQPSAPILNRPLREIEELKDIRVGVICRGNETLVPSGDTEIRAHDHISLLCHRSSAPTVEKLLRVSIDHL